MPQFCPDFDVISKKKGQEKMLQFSHDFDLISKKKSLVFHILISQCHFDGLSEAHGPPPNGPRDGSPEVHGPRGHCPPCSSPLVGPATKSHELVY